jgi:hypothetical protein
MSGFSMKFNLILLNITFLYHRLVCRKDNLFIIIIISKFFLDFSKFNNFFRFIINIERSRFEFYLSFRIFGLFLCLNIMNSLSIFT